MTASDYGMVRTEVHSTHGDSHWGDQDLIRKLPGVNSTRVGYSSGNIANATYRNHGTHVEAIEIMFDPELISYRELLEFFFQIHDPHTESSGQRQGLILSLGHLLRG